MIEGVEILAAEEVASAWEGWNWTSFWIVVGIAFIAAVITGLVSGLNDQSVGFGLVMFAVMLVFISAIFGVLVATTTGEPTEYETHYKVTIDESVLMTEFMEKYEILDQEGRIYTVKEKN